MSNTKKILQENLRIKQKKREYQPNDDFDEWKRLEKWQIGRRNFC